MTMTVETIMQAARLMREFGPPQPAGVRVIYTVNALRHTDERLFPVSLHRSQRILKKLIRRHGGVYRKAPAMLMVDGVVYCHPALKPRLEAQFKLLEDR